MTGDRDFDLSTELVAVIERHRADTQARILANGPWNLVRATRDEQQAAVMIRMARDLLIVAGMKVPELRRDMDAVVERIDTAMRR